MKKFICIAVCIVLTATFMLSGCSNSQQATYDVVLITDGGTITDGSYNQSAWDGVKEYADSVGETCRYYQPVLQDGIITQDIADEYISIAAGVGAQFIVLPTNAFDNVISNIAEQYKEINFILLGSDIVSGLADNVMSVQFSSLQSGFLAGYMAVLSGNSEIGYLGSIVGDKSAKFGAGYIQGAVYAADEIGQPVVLDYADYDDNALQKNYVVTVTANYQKVEEMSKTCYVVNVVNGTGSGTYTDGSNVTVIADPAPKGMVFDHWDYVSDTEGVKDSKVNLSTTKKTETNLLVEKCDCTITAVYTELPEETYGVIVKSADATENYSEVYIDAGASYTVTAPPAESGMVFDHWETTADESVIEDSSSSTTTVYMPEDNPSDIVLQAVYVKSATPTFDIVVTTGEGGNGQSTGSGSYSIGDVVNIAAAVPEEGYIFSSWSNVDLNGFSAGITMDNEYYPYTSFSMVNLYQSIAESMYDAGITLIYSGGNDQINVISDATWNYDFQVWAIGSENYQSSWTNYFTTSMKEYGNAVKLCLEAFKGGSVLEGDCSNSCVNLSYIPEELSEQYDDTYQKMASGEISINDVTTTADIENCYTSNLLTLNYWSSDSIL